MKKDYMTKSKKLIWEYITNHTGVQFSAAELNQYLQEQNYKINVTTVYRNLERMTEEGLLMQYKFADQKCSLYQYAGKLEQCQHHLHLKCQICGKIQHLDCELMNEISMHLKKDHGFNINCGTSIIMGTCEECMSLASQK